jgi:hypothetical protein
MDTTTDNTKPTPTGRRARRPNATRRFVNELHGARLLECFYERWGKDPDAWDWDEIPGVLDADPEWKQWDGKEENWRKRINRALRWAKHDSPDVRSTRKDAKRIVRALCKRGPTDQRGVAKQLGIPYAVLSAKLSGYETFTDNEIERMIYVFRGLPSGLFSRRFVEARQRYEDGLKGRPVRGEQAPSAKHATAPAERVTVTKPAPKAEQLPLAPRVETAPPAQASACPLPRLVEDPAIHAKVCGMVLWFHEHRKIIGHYDLAVLAEMLIDRADMVDRKLAELRARAGDGQ